MGLTVISVFSTPAHLYSPVVGIATYRVCIILRLPHSYEYCRTPCASGYMIEVDALQQGIVSLICVVINHAKYAYIIQTI